MADRKLFLVCEQAVRRHKLAGVVLCLAFACAGAGATGPYLARLGPIPLRFAVKPAASQAGVEAAQNSPAADSTPISTHESAPAPTTNAPSAAISETTAGATVDSGPGSAASVPSVPASFVPTVPLTAMTPQVLAEYFHPVAGRTNAVGAVLVVPVETGFTPPVPKSVVGSQATYRVQ